VTGVRARSHAWLRVLWCLGIAAVFSVLATNRYRRTVAR